MTKKKRPGLTPELDLILDSVCVPVDSAGPITGLTIQVARAQLRALLAVAEAATHAHAKYLKAWHRQANRKEEILGRALNRLVGLSGQQGGRR